MNIRTTALIISFVVLLGGGAYYFITSKPQVLEIIPEITFPNATFTTEGNSSFSSNRPLTITGIDGQRYKIPDVINGKKGDLLPAGTYYHLTNNQEVLGVDASFEIEYGTDNSVTIVLLKESLKDSRLASENSLRSLFALPDEQLCKLDVTINVPAKVNETYADENLGLSFCPNAVVLP